MISAFLLVALGTAVTAYEGHQRLLSVWNEADCPVEVYWIQSETETLIRMSDPDRQIPPGDIVSWNSYISHEFLATERDGGKASRSCRFTLLEEESSEPHVAVSITKDFQCQFMDHTQIVSKMETRNIFAKCQHLQNPELDAHNSVTKLVECIEDAVSKKLETLYNEQSHEIALRKEVARLGENVQCANASVDTSPSLSDHLWHYGREVRNYQVMVKHDRPSSKIHVIQDFVSPEECKVMEDAVKLTLAPALVFDGQGGNSINNQHRKASQAAINVSSLDSPYPLQQLAHRIYAYTNSVMIGLNLTLDGQEPFNSIQYYGRGPRDLEPDRYSPHCDGACNGRKHKPGTRVATMIMYCEVPELGGLTNFGNAGVQIKPRVGDTVFFSYMDPKTRIMDTGFTQHSGCPVYIGKKKIISHWMRLGVDAENPYTNLNTLGQKRDELDEADDPIKRMIEQVNLTVDAFVSKDWIEKLRALHNVEGKAACMQEQCAPTTEH
ncbi:hypothetical protein ACA910_008106 [Epithemia clementina (nom. ined.)]